MVGATARYVTSEEQAWRPGTIADPDGSWSFTYDPAQTPIVSSHRKRIYRGTFERRGPHGPVAACAVAFEPRAVAAFGSECANMGLLASLGVGPRLLATARHQFEGAGVARPVIIEQDAGENLALLLEGRARQEGPAPILHARGTEERELENLKVLYDVYAQMRNAHRAGVYHRDLRCENVCVRRFGGAPADIRATVIDFELSDALDSGRPRARSSLFHTLFREAPTHIRGRQCSVSPNPLELDMGYLAALQYHVARNDLALNGERHAPETLDDFLSFLDESIGFFGYTSPGAPPYARHLSLAIDLDPMAGTLGLVPVNESSFPSSHLLNHAMSYHRPHLDGEDMDACMGGPEARLAGMIDRIAVAKFETYKALRRRQGREVLYERVEDQPKDLIRSNYAQAEHIFQKVRALGYLLVPEDEGAGLDEVRAFTEEQIETLGRMEHDRWVRERLEAGWSLDRRASGSDPESKTSPYLVPYDELSHDIQEYDRDAARQLIHLARSAGLMVVRPNS